MAIDKGASVAGAVAHQGVEHVLHESLARPNHGFHTKFGRARAEQMLIVSFAGCVAEKRFSGHAEALSGADLAVSIDFLQRLSEDPKVRDTYLHRLTAQAEELLETHWSSVEAVATALLERKTISPAQITAAILD